jgi:hypothetical protein
MTAVATAAVLGVLGFFMGVFEKGVEANNKEQIRDVLKEVMVTDSGKSYGAALSEMNDVMIEVKTTVDIIQQDVSDLEDAVLELASE